MARKLIPLLTAAVIILAACQGSPDYVPPPPTKYEIFLNYWWWRAGAFLAGITLVGVTILMVSDKDEEFLSSISTAVLSSGFMFIGGALLTMIVTIAWEYITTTITILVALGCLTALFYGVRYWEDIKDWYEERKNPPEPIG